MMSKTKEHKSDNNKSRIQVSNLKQQEKQLKNEEAQRVKGGGGAMGGVDMRQKPNYVVERTTIGEEIPS